MPKDIEECCSNCKNQVIINCHPGNLTVGAGNMSDVLGYGCTLFSEENNRIIFFERSTGLCECFTKKNEY